MLPKQLKKVQMRLEKQLHLSSAEKELLSELNQLDKTLTESLEFMEKRGEVVKALGGPGDSCPCCGRSM